jgi:Heterokaryon incompatibility protein (HET)
MESYKYNGLQAAAREIRVFRCVGSIQDPDIVIEMQTGSLDRQDCVSYGALSYVWGDPELVSDLVVNGQRLRTTKSVGEIFNVLFRTAEFNGAILASSIRTHWWWINSICINQMDLDERSSQVRIMGQIYQQSCQTIAYVGPSADESDLAAVFVQYHESWDKLGSKHGK